MPPSSPVDPDDLEFAQSLREVEQALLVLKARYAQVQTDQQRQQALQQQQRELHQQLKGGRAAVPAQLRAELKIIQQQLEELEVALESQLFSWNGLKEVFWQAVRFGGFGILLGWALKSLAG